jgi:hypothetical protein
MPTKRIRGDTGPIIASTSIAIPGWLPLVLDADTKVTLIKKDLPAPLAKLDITGDTETKRAPNLFQSL